MNCQEALSLLYEIIDKEASEIDAKEIQKHLDQCKHCFEIYRVESAIQNFINEKLKNGNPEIHLEDLKKKVSSKLDEIDQEEALATRPTFLQRFAPLVAAVATLVLLLGGALLTKDKYRHDTEFLPLEQAHLAALTAPATRHDDSTRIAQTIRKVHDELGYDILPYVNDYSLACCWDEKIMGTQMVHLVYTHDKAVISVFLASAEHFSIPEDAKKNKVTAGAVTLYEHHCPMCRLLFRQVGPAIIVTASTDDSIDLLHFTPGRAVGETLGVLTPNR